MAIKVYVAYFLVNNISKILLFASLFYLKIELSDESLSKSIAQQRYEK